VQRGADTDNRRPPFNDGRVCSGGGPQHLAILSQPPGSVRGTMRVTIQGETIDSHFGLQGTAEQVRYGHASPQ